MLTPEDKAAVAAVKRKIAALVAHGIEADDEDTLDSLTYRLALIEGKARRNRENSLA